MAGSTTVYKRSRSAFYLRINENDDGSFNFLMSQDVLFVFNQRFPELAIASPTGWQQSKNTKNLKNLWIPLNRAPQINLSEIKQWAEFAGNQCVWLKSPKNQFDGTEIDCCIATDFNFTTDGQKIVGRSDLGEAEYKLKYHSTEISSEKKQEYAALMSQSLLNAFDLLPLRFHMPSAGLVVSPIPAQAPDSSLAWAIAKHVAQSKGATFVEPRLLVPKPQMKQLTIQQKVAAWTNIYQTSQSIQLDPNNIRGRKVIIVDDLYQSGVTMWAWAKALRQAGAQNVYGLACVKSMKDSDNK